MMDAAANAIERRPRGMTCLRGLSLRDRFDYQYVVNLQTGCWDWIGAVTGHGYGAINANGRLVPAHRVSHELHKGPIPEGLVIDHLCRNRRCVNPAHIEAVTQLVNSRRGLSGELKTHCIKGHPLAGDNLFMWRGLRHCRKCRNRRWLATPARNARLAQNRRGP